MSNETLRNLTELLEGPDGIVVDRRSRQVRAGDQHVQLTKQGFDLLVLLLEHRGQVLTKEFLAREVWHHDAVSDLHFLHTAVYRVRAALKRAGAESPVVAVRGVGYTIPGTPFGTAEFRPREVLESALRISVVPRIIVDVTRRIRFANEAFASLVGYSIDELEALSSSAVLSPGDRQAERTELFARVLAGESNRSENQPLERRDGSLVEVPVVSVRPVTIDGEIVGAVIECVTRELYHAENAPADSLASRQATLAN